MPQSRFDWHENAEPGGGLVRLLAIRLHREYDPLGLFGATTMMRRVGYLFAVGVMVSCAASAEEPAFHIVGYLPHYRLADFDAAEAQYVTDLVYFSAEPAADGTLKPGPLDAKGLKKLQSIKARHQVRLSLCVGGWGRSAAFAAIAGSPDARRRFTAEAMRFCQENQFDGIDLDWEHPANEAERDDYGRLIVELRSGCRPLGLLVTAAIADWQTLPAAAISEVDRIHLMAYDARGRHATYAYAVSAVERVVKAGVPKAKICLGVPFYGRRIDDSNQALSYAEIVRRYQPPPANDEADGIYFNGINTIRRKVAFARDEGLAGMMIWELGQDAGGDASLLRGLHRAASGRPGKAPRE